MIEMNADDREPLWIKTLHKDWDGLLSAGWKRFRREHHGKLTPVSIEGNPAYERNGYIRTFREINEG